MSENKNTIRQLVTRVKTAKRRSISSTKWLFRQLNDPYVVQSKEDGYRSRAAYKLIEINEKFNFLRSNSVVIDLGAAPGGWTQVAIEKIKPNNGGKVVGIDLVEIEPIEGAILIQQDFLSDKAEQMIKDYLVEKADIVLSDMAAPSCGHPRTDHIRIIALCEAAYLFAKDVLAPEGVFVAKILKGGTESHLLVSLKQDFKIVKHFKPPASRKESAESYVIAMGFRGGVEKND
jgi:23S rRNA (uridine2552-2'-O)-methyltransferase